MINAKYLRRMKWGAVYLGSMFLGAQAVHWYYKPLEDLGDMVKAEGRAMIQQSLEVVQEPTKTEEQ